MNNYNKPALAAIVVLLTVSVGPALAQPQPNAPTEASEADVIPDGQTTQNAPQDKEEKPAETARPSAHPGTSNDRLFNLLPNFLTLENAGQIPPLTAGGKFKAVARGTFDVVNLPWWGLLAGISQASDGDSGYGQGLKGYAKRFGAAAGDGIIENFLTSAAFPSLLHQDPRFYQSGKGGFFHRFAYAATRVVVTRGDSGSRQVNFSEILGAGAAGAIGTYTYHPRNERTFSDVVSTWYSQMAYDALSYVVKEFWPDIRRKMNHKSKTATPVP